MLAKYSIQQLFLTGVLKTPRVPHKVAKVVLQFIVIEKNIIILSGSENYFKGSFSLKRLRKVYSVGTQIQVFALLSMITNAYGIFSLRRHLLHLHVPSAVNHSCISYILYLYYKYLHKQVHTYITDSVRMHITLYTLARYKNIMHTNTNIQIP